jgi:hypothetical protein
MTAPRASSCIRPSRQRLSPRGRKVKSRRVPRVRMHQCVTHMHVSASRPAPGVSERPRPCRGLLRSPQTKVRKAASMRASLIEQGAYIDQSANMTVPGASERTDSLAALSLVPTKNTCSELRGSGFSWDCSIIIQASPSCVHACMYMFLTCPGTYIKSQAGRGGEKGPPPPWVPNEQHERRRRIDRVIAAPIFTRGIALRYPMDSAHLGPFPTKSSGVGTCHF